MSINKSSTNRFPPALSGVLIGVVIFIIGVFIAYSQFLVQDSSERAETREVLSLIEQNIQRTISEGYSVALLLSQTITMDGEVRNFENVSKQLLENHESVDVLQLVPDGIIQHVYPLEGNELVIGYNILSDENVNREVMRAAEINSMYFAGPLKLRQGGQAVIGRLPVRRNDGELWGFSEVIIFMETLIEQSSIPTFSDRYHIQLSKVNPNTGVEEFFLDTDVNVNPGRFQKIEFPEGNWNLYGSKVDQSSPKNIFLYISSLSLLIGILFGYLSYKLFKKPFELEALIQEQSQELFDSKEQFRKNSELLTSVLESPQNIMIFSLDRFYNYIAFNENYYVLTEELFGIPIREGMNIFDVVPKKNRALLMVNYNRALNGESFDFMQEIVDQDLVSHYWQNWFSPIKDSNGSIIGLTVFSIDITQRIEAEKELERNESRLRTLISSSPYCIHELDIEGRIISINEAGVQMFKLESTDQLIGRYYPVLIGKKHSTMVDRLLNETLMGEPTEFEFSNGEYFYQSQMIPLKNEDDIVVRVMGITQDITERRKSEEFIENSLKEKTTLLAEIHHRVKNNLAIVSGLLELQKVEVDDDRLSAIFDQSINRIISIAMVHELMYNTQDLSSVNVHAYLEKLIPAISATMQNQKQNVEFDLDVIQYKLNINQAIPLGLLLNELITNSFKYAFNGSGNNKITIKLDSEGDDLKVFYHDNGRGFPDDIDFNIPVNLGLNLIHAQLQQLDAEFNADTKKQFELQFQFAATERGSHSNFN